MTIVNYFKIADLYALEVLDSRGCPTVEAHVTIDTGDKIISDFAIVPSGASTGSFEALEIRDGGKRYRGKGVIKAVENVNKIIAPKLIGMNSLNQLKIDNTLIELDGTEDKSRLGANSILAVSMAVARVSAHGLGIPLYRYLGGINTNVLPMPMLNIMNGGRHADNNIDIQEFMIMPIGARTFGDCMEMSSQVYTSLKQVLREKGLSTGLGDEGGFAPDLRDTSSVIGCILEAVERAGYTGGRDIALALDVAASELYEEGFYHFKGESSASGREIKRTADEMIDYYKDLVSTYPIISIEDGLAEEDWLGWQRLTRELGGKIQLVGDDLFVTNTSRIKKGISLGCGNSVLIKVNQIGTLTEAFKAVELAKSRGMSAVISHRSGESEDSIIADIALALGTGQIKTGAPCRTDRVAKYNRLLRIEKELGENSVFAPYFNRG